MNSTSYSNSIEKYNNSIRDLWKTEFKNAINVSNNSKVIFTQPCFHVTQCESPVWFLGMNPSLAKSPKKNISQNSNLTKDLMYELSQEQKHMHKEHQYFKAAKKFFNDDVGIAELVNPIFHDLYPIRHTQQKEFEKFLDQNSSLCDSLDEATKKLITGVMPNLIIIANAGASKRIQKLFHPKFDTNSTKLTFEANGKKTDMIFSSMLSGQRALDTYSRSRLANEIRENWNSRNNK